MDTYRDAAGERIGKPFRGEVIHTASGKVLFTTWPYRSEKSALYRAWRWLRDEYRQYPRHGLFAKDAGAKDGER